MKTCLEKKDGIRLQITEFTFLPAGDNWEWVNGKIGFQQIFVKENELMVLKQVPAFETTTIDTLQADIFLSSARNLKGTGKIETPEELLDRLEFLALNRYRVHDLSDCFNKLNCLFTIKRSGQKTLMESPLNYFLMLLLKILHHLLTLRSPSIGILIFIVSRKVKNIKKVFYTSLAGLAYPSLKK